MQSNSNNQYNRQNAGQQYTNQYAQQQSVQQEQQKLQEKKKSIKIASGTLAVLLVVLLCVLLIRSCGNNTKPSSGGYVNYPQEEVVPQQPVQTEPPVQEELIAQTEAPVQEELIAQTEAPVQENLTEPTIPTQQPVVTYEYRYEIIRSDMSWSEAKAACEAKGGYLATITTIEEYDKIAQLANQTDLVYLWLGACLPNTNTTWQQAGWITGESWSFENWYRGEPSLYDDDGELEYCLSMWRVEGGPWTFNDQRNDIVESLPSIAGLVGYVCEYKIEVVQ